MPLAPGGPDRYFTSKLDPKVLSSWITDIRNSLVAMNTVNPSNANNVVNPNSTQALTQFLGGGLTSYGLYSASKATQGKLNAQTASLHDYTKQITDQYKLVNIAAHIKIDNAMYGTHDLNTYLGGNSPETPGYEGYMSEKNFSKYMSYRNKFKLVTKGLYYTQNDSGNQFDDSVNTMGTSLGIIDSRNLDLKSDRYPYDVIVGTQPVDPTNPDGPTQPVTKNISEVLSGNTKAITDLYSGRVGNKLVYDVLTGYKHSTAIPNDRLFKSWAKVDKNGTETVDASRTFTASNAYSDFLDKIVQDVQAQNQTEMFSGSFKFFIEKLHDRTGSGKPNRKNPIKSTKGKNTPESLTNRMVFAAYIDNFYDDYNVQWNNYNFIGRAEEVPIYKSTKRSLTLVFDIISDHSLQHMIALESLNKLYANDDSLLEKILGSQQDRGMGYYDALGFHNNQDNPSRTNNHIPGLISDTPESLWDKMTFLTQCVYPYYRADGKMKEQPFIRIRIGDFYDVVGCINNLSYELVESEGLTMDMNPSSLGNIPLYVKVNLKIDIYHNDEPSSNYYGFYHRKEFDTKTIAQVTGLSTDTEDKTKKTHVKHSPTKSAILNQKDDFLSLPSGFSSMFNELESNLNSFSKSFKKLKTPGLKLKDEMYKKALKDSTESAVKIQDIARQIQQVQGESSGASAMISGTTNIDPNDIKASKKKGFGDKFLEVYGHAQNVVQTSTSIINRANQELNKFGIGLSKSNDIQAISKAVNNVRPEVFIPKTIGDILGNIIK